MTYLCLSRGPFFDRSLSDERQVKGMEVPSHVTTSSCEVGINLLINSVVFFEDSAR